MTLTQLVLTWLATRSDGLVAVVAATLAAAVGVLAALRAVAARPRGAVVTDGMAPVHPDPGPERP